MCMNSSIDATPSLPVREPSKSSGNYVFPKPVARGLLKISQRTQYEASMLSMVFIILGLIATGIYVIFYSDVLRFYKIMTAVNCIAGLVLLTSWIATTYQQYYAYLQIAGLLKTGKQINQIE